MPANQIALVIDTTNRWILVGLFGEKLHQSQKILAPRDSFTRLMGSIKELLTEAKIQRPDWIAVSIGPGSFTGTRVGVAAARNLGQLWNLPVLGFDSPGAYHHSVRTRNSSMKDPVAILLDAKQKKVYGHIFASPDDLSQQVAPLDEPPHRILESLNDTRTRVYVDDPEAVESYFPEGFQNSLPLHLLEIPEPEELYNYAIKLGGFALAGSWEECRPLYVRADPATAKYPHGFDRKTQ